MKKEPFHCSSYYIIENIMDYQRDFQNITDKYSGIILNWAVKKTGSRADGEDLAQEVFLQVFLSIARGTRIQKLENYIWKAAHFCWCNYLRKIKKTGDFLPLDENLRDGYDFTEELAEKDRFESEITLMRRKIADLSGLQRNTLIFHYLDGLSVARVAEKLGIKPSAVKKHLYHARNKLKKEMGEMKTETSYIYQPGRLKVGGSGMMPPEPDTNKVNDNLVRQNILLLCYKTPKTIDDLAGLTGIPKPYLEPELKWLTEREFLTLTGKKYATIIPITGKKHHQDIGELYRSERHELIDVVIDYLEEKMPEIRKIGFYGADFPTARMMWPVMMLFLSYFSRNSETATRLKKRDSREIRPDGGKYYVIGNDLSDNQDINPEGYFNPDAWSHFYGIVSDSCETEGKTDSYYWLGVYNFSGKEYRPEITDENNKHAQKAWHKLYCSLIEPGFSAAQLSSDEKEMLTSAIQKGFVARDNGAYKPAFIILTAEQLRRLQKEIFAPLLARITPKLKETAQAITEIHAKNMPRINEGYTDYFTYVDLWKFGIYALMFAGQDGKLYLPKTGEEGAHLTLVVVR